MKRFLIVVSFAVLVSCGGKPSSNSGVERDEFKPCGGEKEIVQSACLTPAKWILNTRLTNLPKNMRLTQAIRELDGSDYTHVVADSCLDPKAFKLISDRIGSSIFLETLRFLLVDTFTVELIDLGDDCKGDTTLIKSERTKEDIRAGDQRGSFSLDLD